MSAVKTVPAYVIYKMGKLLDQSVSMLDPLGFDKYFVTSTFTQAASSDDPRFIIDFEAEVVSPISTDFVNSLNEVSAMAAARDLNMIASAATKFGIPMHKLPNLEELMLILAQKTYEVPTDTVFGYGTRNPIGERQRSFTKTKEESLFIEAFSAGMSGLIVTLAGLETIQSLEITNPRLSALALDSSVHLQQMQEAILNVRQHITPDFFTNRLRPFFDPKTLRGSTYFAAGGAQMPVTMIDLLLWGVEDTDRTYVGYRNENLRYLPRSYRSKVESIMSLPSILTSVTTQVQRGVTKGLRKTAIVNLRSLQDLADQMIRFRAPHLGVAKANMSIRSNGSVGSGGYDLSILQYLIKRTKEFKAQIANLEQQLTEDSS